MLVRRGPAIMLSLVLGAAALISAPGALARDGGAAKDNNAEVQKDECRGASDAVVRLKVVGIEGNNNRFRAAAVVFSDDTDLWDWKLRVNGAVTDEGRTRGRTDSDLAFRVTRSVLNFPGPDTVTFRADNLRSGAVCRATVNY